jgi:hypothetical protein
MVYETPNKTILCAGLNGLLLELFQLSPINYWGPVQTWIQKMGIYNSLFVICVIARQM